MSPEAINSPMAAQHNHSLSRRWTSGSGIRRRSGCGGKSGPQASTHFALLALPHFQPHQKTIAQHYRDGVAMKTIPAPSLILIPAQLGFGFLMILLDPVAAMGILDHPGQRRGGRAITPEILPVPMLAPSGALPNQPAQMAAASAIHLPTAQRHKLRPPSPFGLCAPRDCLPILARLRRQHRRSLPHRTLRPASQRDAEIGPHRHHMTLAALLQPVKEVGIIAIIGITGHTRVPHPTGPGFALRHNRFDTPCHLYGVVALRNFRRRRTIRSLGLPNSRRSDSVEN